MSCEGGGKIAAPCVTRPGDRQVRALLSDWFKSSCRLSNSSDCYVRLARLTALAKPDSATNLLLRYTYCVSLIMTDSNTLSDDPSKR